MFLGGKIKTSFRGSAQQTQQPISPQSISDAPVIFLYGDRLGQRLNVAGHENANSHFWCKVKTVKCDSKHKRFSNS
jgi:hypothetical protein